MPISWRIELLGGLRARRLDEPFLQNATPMSPLDHFRSRGEGTLLALLAFSARPHTREVLSERLWPQHDPRLSRNHLRVVLSTLRRRLIMWDEAAADFLVIDRASIGINQNRATTDVAEFENALGQAAQTANRDAQRGHLARGVEVYRGTLLPGFYENWIMPEAHRLEELYFGALRQLVAGWEADGDLECALHYARRGASVDIGREDVGRDLMRLYTATGQSALALRHYHDLERALQRDLNVAPDPQTRELFARLERQARGGFHPAQQPIVFEGAEQPRRPWMTPLTVGAPHLPPQWTRFFGRETEIAAVRSRLSQGETRLVTLTGTGGSGKTRLALEIARTLADESCDSLWFVPLQNATDTRLIASEIVGAMRLPHLAQATPLEQAVQSLNERAQPLLVLDNFEQLLPAGAAIVQELLARVPQLKLIVTSRQALQIADEHPFWVPPLPIPDLGLAPDELARVESVQLFHDRARSARPNFRVTNSNAAALAQLCARLEGLPLAIELCAARAGAFSPAQMLKRLERRFDFLTQAPQGSTSRHSTLRAALEWSYALLWPELQTFFAVLGVFRGGCTAAAAAAIAGEPHAAHLLHQLRLVSLAQSAEVDGETRFSLLESVREFAGEKLDCAVETELRRRHAEFYLALAAAAYPQLLGSERQRLWMDQLEREHDNLRAALRWFADNEPESGLRLAVFMARFWKISTRFGEMRAALEVALERVQGRTVPVATRIVALRELGESVQWLTDHQSGDEFIEASVQLSRETGDLKNLAWSLRRLIDSAKARGETERVRMLLDESLAIERASGNKAGLAAALGYAGCWSRNHGDMETARRNYEQSVALWREVGHRSNAAVSQVRLASLAYWQGDIEEARSAGAQSLATLREMRQTYDLLWGLRDLGAAAFDAGEDETARALVEEYLALCREMNDEAGQIRALWQLARIARRAGHNAQACAYWESLFALVTPATAPSLMRNIIEACAQWAATQAQWEVAARLFSAVADTQDAERWSELSFNHEASIQIVRAALNVEAFSQVGAMTLEEAIKYARTELLADAPVPRISK